jgi:predicted dithiol-disulfide oxidoreductase (DUF899 family)
MTRTGDGTHGAPTGADDEGANDMTTTGIDTSRMDTPPVVSPEEWQAARDPLLDKEKAATRVRDELAAERRRLPWVEIDKDYRFVGPDGDLTLADLFDGRTQLIVYRAFFEPGVENWPDGGCSGCAMFIDNVGHLAHLNERDTTFVLVSPAPIDAIDRYKSRMGWDIPWFSTVDDFSADFGVDEYFGLNVFIRADDRTYRTYFTNGRAADAIGNVWSLLDITPLGRQEEWENSPDGYPQDPPYSWWKLHDEYEGADETSAS